MPGPYSGAVERVVDGDTVAVRVRVWLEQDLRVLVRVRGIDTPELRGECDSERARAGKAREVLSHLVAGGPIVLTNIEGDKYFGRVVADVLTSGGDDVGKALLATGLARRYDGRSRAAWCALGAREPASEEAIARAGE